MMNAGVKNPPATDSERLLYRVLQRANLLSYFDTFVAQGGDDVTQLCEAGEDEFLEIMALVGMASKPLHVRRLQKALQEWVTNPALFIRTTPRAVRSPVTNSNGGNNNNGSSNTLLQQFNNQDSPIVITTQTRSPTDSPLLKSESDLSMSSFAESGPAWKTILPYNGGAVPSPSFLDISNTGSVSPTPSVTGSDRLSPAPGSAHTGIPVLSEAQIAAIEEATDTLLPELTNYEVRPLNMKKEHNRQLMQVLAMPEDDPQRAPLIRKFSAIYARFDSKRKNDGKMTMHEVSVNEASAQLCKRMPALLTRRDDLYPLSRRVVRDSGYQYSKGHSRALNEHSPSKKQKLTETAERIFEIDEELKKNAQEQTQLKYRIQTARTNKQFAALDTLRGELEAFIAKQLRLRMEQNSIMAAIKGTESQAESTQENGATLTQAGQSLLMQVNSSAKTGDAHSQSNNRSLLRVNHNIGNNRVGDIRLSDNGELPSTTSLSAADKSTLVEETIRMAQQYGMADFAQQLINDISPNSSRKDNNAPLMGINTRKGAQAVEIEDSDSELDAQEEWNREVEKDMIKQNLLTPEKVQGTNS